MKNRKTLFITVIIIVFVLLFEASSCVYEDLETDLSTMNIYPITTNTYDIGSLALQYHNGYFQHLFINGVAVGGGGLEIDPVFIAHPSYGITADNISGWSAHPLLTTGTHGVTGTIVGTSDAQSLTNKKMTMDNNEPIYWDNTVGTDVNVLNLWADDNLHILDGESGDIFVWLSSGTGERMFLWPTGSTAISTLQDSPTLDFVANYWDTTNKNWEAKIIHNMMTAGSSPKSRLSFSVNDTSVLELENNSGKVTAIVPSLNMTGIIWDDIRTPVNAIRVSGTNPPTWTDYRGSQVLAFSNAPVNEEQVYFSIQMPHDYKLGTDLYLHTHFVYSTNETATLARWGLSYSWADLDNKFPTQTTIYIDSPYDNANGADFHNMASFAPIDGSGISSLSSMMLCKLFRNSSHVSDNYTGSVYLLEIDAHYLKDSLGGSTQLVK